MSKTEEILFISDLHLDPEKPHTMRLFFRFLQERAGQVQALYILGDLFEFWIGPGSERNEGVGQVLRALRELVDGGVDLFVMGGNRDFLLDGGFAQLAGATLLTDPYPVQVGELRLCLTHGDLLCIQDVAYQRFRKVVRHPAVRLLFRRLPYALRKGMAQGLRKKSREDTARKVYTVMDVVEEAVKEMCSAHGCQILVHGHTHRPGVHEGAGWRRFVLGAWEERAEYLVLRDGELVMEAFG